MFDAALDLFLGSRCAGCGTPGRMLCRDCRAVLPNSARIAWPSPVPTGLVTPWSMASYDGAIRELIVGHKDRGQFGHRRLLGGLLARSVTAAVAALDDGHPVLLVPVPSRPGSARRRGYDPAAALVATAARTMDTSREVRVARLLVSRGGVADQAGLGAAERSANMAGSMACPSSGVTRLRRGLLRAHVVLCDDVLTTGATAREAQRALTAAGLAPAALATIAATARRSSFRADEDPA